MFPKIVRSGFIILVAFCLGACGKVIVSSPPVEKPFADQQVAERLPANTPVPSTATSLPTATPPPTITPTATLVPTATPDARGTQAAIARGTEQALTEEIKAELEKLGLPTAGKLGWVGTKTNRVDVSTYNGTDYLSIANDKEFSNFVLKVDISWVSESGLAGCGVVFRSESPAFPMANHYEFLTMRLSGAPAWVFGYYDASKFSSKKIGDVKFNKTIDITNGGTNTYYLVAKGDDMSVYTKGKRLGLVTYSKLTNGSLAWIAFQESGKTTCTFKNAWIWELP